MLVLNFNPFPDISTERLSLRRMTGDDAEEIFFLRSDKQMLQYLDRDPARSVDEALNWIKMINEGIDNDQYIAWGIALKNEPRLIGTITFWNVKKEHYRAELGYLLHTGYQGKGLMREAAVAVLDFGFNIMKLHSVEANVNPANQASINLLERSNFVREAYFKENYYYNGTFFDSVIYSLLAPFSKV